VSGKGQLEPAKHLFRKLEGKLDKFFKLTFAYLVPVSCASRYGIMGYLLPFVSPIWNVFGLSIIGCSADPTESDICEIVGFIALSLILYQERNNRSLIGKTYVCSLKIQCRTIVCLWEQYCWASFIHSLEVGDPHSTTTKRRVRSANTRIRGFLLGRTRRFLTLYIYSRGFSRISWRDYFDLFHIIPNCLNKSKRAKK
jgi:hypothetical protein